jgi:thiamine biosynthesis protein ThiS
MPPSSAPEPNMPAAPSISISICLNGRPDRVAAGTTVADLVARTLPNARAYAVELNRAVLSRREHATREVAEGDVVEVVTLVGGG